MMIEMEEKYLKEIRSDMRSFLRCANNPTQTHMDNWGCSDGTCYAVGDFAKYAIKKINAALRASRRRKS